MTLADVDLPLDIEDYITWLATEKGRSANTLSAYRRDLRAYWSWLQERGVALDDVSPRDVEAYVGTLRDEGRAPATAYTVWSGTTTRPWAHCEAPPGLVTKRPV